MWKGVTGNSYSGLAVTQNYDAIKTPPLNIVFLGGGERALKEKTCQSEKGH
jgi:hypothetical protein